jgi:hypothetical protein
MASPFHTTEIASDSFSERCHREEESVVRMARRTTIFTSAEKIQKPGGDTELRFSRGTCLI